MTANDLDLKIQSKRRQLSDTQDLFTQPDCKVASTNDKCGQLRRELTALLDLRGRARKSS